MSNKRTYAELEQKIRELEEEVNSLRQHSAFFECIFRAIPDPAVFADTERRIVLSNPALSRVFGYSEDEIKGRHTAIFYTSREAYEEQGKLRFNLDAAEKLSPYEVSYRKKNGQIFASETVGTAVAGRDGKPLGYLGIMRDISKRKKAENALRKAHDILEQRVRKRTDELRKERDKAQQYLDIAGVIIVVLDMNGNVSLINKKGASLLGYTEKEIVGKNWFDTFIPEYEKARVKAGFSKLIAGETAPLNPFENIIVTRDGEERLIEWNNTVLKDTQGNITNTLSSGNDIADRHKTELARQESLEKIKRFAYSVSHDLKNPTISLIGLTRHLSEKYEEVFDEKGKQWCRQIMTTSEQINVFVENINRFIATTEIPFSFEKVNLKEIIGIIREEFSSQLLNHRVTLSHPEVMPIIKADRLSIIRVLRNFIDNSLKYGGDDLTSIEIGYQENADTHIVSVRDDGNGFNEEEREIMFKPFYRNAASGYVNGTGLGLAIAKEIAERHGGKAWAEPDIEHGATFYISISKALK